VGFAADFFDVDFAALDLLAVFLVAATFDAALGAGFDVDLAVDFEVGFVVAFVDDAFEVGFDVDLDVDFEAVDLVGLDDFDADLVDGLATVLRTRSVCPAMAFDPLIPFSDLSRVVDNP
jgi:hypothetical protein